MEHYSAGLLQVELGLCDKSDILVHCLEDRADAERTHKEVSLCYSTKAQMTSVLKDIRAQQDQAKVHLVQNPVSDTSQPEWKGNRPVSHVVSFPVLLSPGSLSTYTRYLGLDITFLAYRPSCSQAYREN